MPKKKKTGERPTLQALKQQAEKAANEKASELSGEKTGHGRKPHGKDAKGKSQHHDASKDAREAWKKIYEQTLGRLKKEHGYS